MMVLDINKAFDSVNIAAMLTKLHPVIPDWMYLLIHSIYKDGTKGQVYLMGEYSQVYTQLTGVRQGCPISPALFIFVISDSLTEVQLKMIKMGIGKIWAFADDITIICRTLYELQVCIEKLESKLEKLGLHFNPEKCLILHFGRCKEAVPTAGLSQYPRGTKVKVMGITFNEVYRREECQVEMVNEFIDQLNLVNQIPLTWQERGLMISVVLGPRIIYRLAPHAPLIEAIGKRVHGAVRDTLTAVQGLPHNLSPKTLYTRPLEGGLGIVDVCATTNFLHTGSEENNTRLPTRHFGHKDSDKV